MNEYRVYIIGDIMQTISLNTKLIFQSELDKKALIEILEAERTVFNYCAEYQFGKSKNSIVELHKNCYNNIKKIYPKFKSQIIIKGENNCLTSFRCIKSCKHKILKPPVKKRLATHFDKRLFRYKNGNFELTTLNNRISVSLIMYPKLEEYLSKYNFGDIHLCVKNNFIFISLFFKIPTIESKQNLAAGVDVGIRRYATTSDGKLLISKSHNKRKRQIRHLKDKLKSNGSQTARKHLFKVRHKERNINHNFNHHLANEILKTKANVIVLEDLDVKKLKSKRNRYQNKNRISQVSLSEIRRILTYKAGLVGKLVVCVSPYYTSQIDHVTGKLEGERKGCRFYSKSGLIYDADVNAAVNIAKRSNLPILCSNVLDGQGFVVDLLH